MKKVTHVLYIALALLNSIAAPAMANDKIRLGGSKVLSVLPLIAVEQGYFKEKAIDLEFQNIEVGKFAMDAVLANSVDIGSIVDSNIAFNSFNKKSDLVVLASILTLQTNGMLANSTLDPSRDIKGKRVGFFPATTSHLYLLYYLRANGLTSKDIVPVTIQPPAMLHALKENSVDVVSIWNPWRYNIIKSLGTTVKEFPLDKTIYPARGYIATTKAYLEGHKDLVIRFAGALKKAEEYVKNNPDQVFRRYAEWNNMEPDTADTMKECLIIELRTDDSIEKIVQDDLEIIKTEMPEYKNRMNRPATDSFNYFLNNTYN